jgi:SpoVK/Ycf46/Vps4 family AAA+-type ATPase
LIGGISGTGKSLTAKAVATAWGVPLLRIDLGALRSKYVGESEGNLRRALRVIEAIGRCVVWLDEIEKALAGATQGAADGGVSSDALGALLVWMQERVGEAFVIATTNDAAALPPEITRKGRFDELWWVDLPNAVERREIALTALRAHARDKIEVDLDSIAGTTTEFTGSEIAALVPEAMFTAYADNGRKITTADILAAAENVVPLAKTMGDKIEALRSWAAGRARSATSPETTRPSRTRVRAIDL